MIQTLTLLEPWKQDYSFEAEPALVRGTTRGLVRQRQTAKRRIITADVSRRLYGAQIPYWMSFVYYKINQGNDRFIDYYADENGLQQGVVKLVNGAYRLEGDEAGTSATLTAQLEIQIGYIP